MQKSSEFCRESSQIEAIIEEIRQKPRFSQQVLSILLGVSRPLLTLAEAKESLGAVGRF